MKKIVQNWKIQYFPEFYFILNWINITQPNSMKLSYFITSFWDEIWQKLRTESFKFLLKILNGISSYFKINITNSNRTYLLFNNNNNNLFSRRSNTISHLGRITREIFQFLSWRWLETNFPLDKKMYYNLWQWMNHHSVKWTWEDT